MARTTLFLCVRNFDGHPPQLFSLRQSEYDACRFVYSYRINQSTKEQR